MASPVRIRTRRSTGQQAPRHMTPEAFGPADPVLAQFIAHAPAAIAMFDRDLRYVAHTRRWAADHGVEGMCLIDKPQSDVLPHLWHGWQEAYARCLAGETIEDAETAIPAADGSDTWLKWSLKPLHGPDGALSGLIMLTQDITAQKAVRAQLRNAIETAEAAARAKADFLANMSHELRTPLSGIIGTADLLLQDQDDRLSPDHRRTIEVQRTAGADLLAIVNDILDFSKADAGNLQLESIPVDLRALVDQALATIGPAASERRVGLTTSIARDIPERFAGDPTRLRQIVLNLLSNAVKFTGDGGEVSLDVRLVESGHLRVAVSDTGIGIAPAKIATLFTRFSQADPSTTRTHGGTGLGLAICRQLVELMGGRIGVRSMQGFGSTFQFEIPIECVAERPLRPADATPRSRRARRVLVAEDNPTNRMLIGRMLERFDCVVTFANDGLSAVAAATAPDAAFDLVLMDIQMPGLDGTSATGRIRAYEAAHPYRSRLPIIALTANGYPDDVARYADAGMDAHVLKPIDWPRLLATIEDLTGDGDDPDADRAAE